MLNGRSFLALSISLLSAAAFGGCASSGGAASYLTCSAPTGAIVVDTSKIPASMGRKAVKYPDVELVAWSDFHSSIYEQKRDDSEALGGLPIFMAAVERARGNGLSLLLDSGDMFQGAMPFNESKGLGMAEVMNALKIDAATLGNHEFDYGPGARYTDTARGALREVIEASSFPWVNANLTSLDGNPDPWLTEHVKPYAIIEKGPYRIAVIGVLAIETPIATIAANVEGLKFENVAESLARVIPDLVAKEKPDFVVVEAHVTGTPQPLPPRGTILNDAKFDGEIAEILALPEDIRKHIDLIAAAHSHKSFISYNGDLTVIENLSGGREFTTMTLKGGADGLKIDRSTIRKHYMSHIPTEAACGEEQPPLKPIKIDGTILMPSQTGRDIITKYENLMTVNRCAVVGCADELIVRNYAGEDPLGNLITDAMLSYYPDAVAAFQNAGGIRIDLPKGPIYRETLNNLMPFENYLHLIELPGEDLIRILKLGSSQYHGVTQVSGVRYGIEPGCTNPDDVNGDGRTEAWENNCLCAGPTFADGKPINPKHRYKIAVSDFLFNGGDDHGGIFNRATVLDRGPVMKDVILKYVQKSNSCYSTAELASEKSPRITIGTCKAKYGASKNGK